MATSPFTWGAQGKKMSPEEVARQRAVAALLSQEAIDTSPVGHWSQGAARLVNAFSGVRKERQASAAEEQGRSGAKSVIDALLGGGGGTYGAPSMSSMGGGSPGGTWTPGQAPKVTDTPGMEGGGSFGLPAAPAVGGGADLGFGSATMTPQEMIIAGAEARGLNPIDVATAISYETGGTFDPVKAGPTTQWGQHRGLIQFGEPQAQQYGADFSSPEAAMRSQLDPTKGAVWNYLDQTGVQPGMGLDNIYSAINAGAPGRFNASDANNGGAPGTVADKVAGMGDHRAKAAQFLGGTWTPAAGGGNVTMSAQNAPSAGGYAPQMQGTSPVMQALLQASTDPWVAQEYGPVLQALMGQEQSRQQFAMEQADPMRQLQMQKAQLEIEQMRNPAAPKPIEVGGVLLDPVTYQPIFDSRQADGAKAPETKTVKMQDGSDVLVQWNPATQVWDAAPIPQGGTGGAAPGKLTESQAKTTLFQNLQTETQPVLLDLEKQFDPANMADKAAANLPIVGNYFTSPEYQLYKSNATAWAEGALRISTGAAATEPEIQRNLETYFAQPGDTPMTVAYKAQMREMYNRSIQRSLGRDPGDEKLPLPSEFAAQFAAQQPPPKMGGVLPPPPGMEQPAPTPAPQPERQGATPFRSRGLSPAPPESAPIEDISALPTVQSPDEARRLPSGTRFRDPQGNIRMVP